MEMMYQSKDWEIEKGENGYYEITHYHGNNYHFIEIQIKDNQIVKVSDYGGGIYESLK